MVDETPSGAEQGALARPVSTRQGEFMAAAALLAAGVFFTWQSVSIPFGKVGLPGPGFFPFVLGILLCLFALAIAIRAILQPTDAAAIYLGHRDVLIVFAALIGASIAFELLGAYATLGMFAAILLVLIARLSLLRAVLAAGIGMIAVWAIFKVALGVRLPTGPF